jgi:hypothetical protein
MSVGMYEGFRQIDITSIKKKKTHCKVLNIDGL